jgi:hypothetical protein
MYAVGLSRKVFRLVYNPRFKHKGAQASAYKLTTSSSKYLPATSTKKLKRYLFLKSIRRANGCSIVERLFTNLACFYFLLSKHRTSQWTALGLMLSP